MGCSKSLLGFRVDSQIATKVAKFPTIVSAKTLHGSHSIALWLAQGRNKSRTKLEHE